MSVHSRESQKTAKLNSNVFHSSVTPFVTLLANAQERMSSGPVFVSPQWPDWSGGLRAGWIVIPRLGKNSPLLPLPRSWQLLSISAHNRKDKPQSTVAN